VRGQVAGFEALIREQLRHYVQRHTAQAIQGAAASGSAIGHVLFVLKLLSATIDDVHSRVDEMAAIYLDPNGESRQSRVWLKDQASELKTRPASPVRHSNASQQTLGIASPHAGTSGGEVPSTDISLHCKVDKLISMMTTLVSTLTPTSTCAKREVPPAGEAEDKDSPLVSVPPSSKDIRPPSPIWNQHGSTLEGEEDQVAGSSRSGGGWLAKAGAALDRATARRGETGPGKAKNLSTGTVHCELGQSSDGTAAMVSSAVTLPEVCEVVSPHVPRPLPQPQQRHADIEEDHDAMQVQSDEEGEQERAVGQPNCSPVAASTSSAWRKFDTDGRPQAADQASFWSLPVQQPSDCADVHSHIPAHSCPSTVPQHGFLRHSKIEVGDEFGGNGTMALPGREDKSVTKVSLECMEEEMHLNQVALLHNMTQLLSIADDDASIGELGKMTQLLSLADDDGLIEGLG